MCLERTKKGSKEERRQKKEIGPILRKQGTAGRSTEKKEKRKEKREKRKEKREKRKEKKEVRRYLLNRRN